MSNEIERYNFGRTETYWEDLLDTITENGIFDGYFDKIEFYDVENRTNKSGLVFYIGEKIALEMYTNDMPMTSSGDFDVNFYLANGSKFVFHYGGGGNHFFDRLTKTENGIVMRMNSNISKNSEGIIVTKTDKGSIGFAFVTYIDNVYDVGGSSKFYCASFENSKSFKPSLHTLPNMVEEENVTTLKPLPCRDCANPELLKGCYLMADSEYKGIPCNFMWNDKQYVSNGYLALEV